MRLFGVVITTGKAIMRERMENASYDAQFQLRTLLQDREHPIRGAIVKVARSAVKDYLGEQAEAGRARFELDPEFQAWARERREHELAVEKAAKETALAAPPLERVPAQLRFGILGLLMEHGVQFDASIQDAFDDWPPEMVTQALQGLVSDALVTVRNGVYCSAWHAALGFPKDEKEARNEDPDSQQRADGADRVRRADQDAAAAPEGDGA